jgi:hypothetical protein
MMLELRDLEPAEEVSVVVDIVGTLVIDVGVIVVDRRGFISSDIPEGGLLGLEPALRLPAGGVCPALGLLPPPDPAPPITGSVVHVMILKRAAPAIMTMRQHE